MQRLLLSAMVSVYRLSSVVSLMLVVEQAVAVGLKRRLQEAEAQEAEAPPKPGASSSSQGADSAQPFQKSWWCEAAIASG